MRSRYETTCPFCGGKIVIDNNLIGDCAGVAHTAPFCNKFAEAEDALDFVIKVRVQLADGGMS